MLGPKVAEKDNIKEIRDTVNRLNGEVAQLSERISDLRGHSDKRIDDLNSHLRIYFTVTWALIASLLIPVVLRFLGVI